MSSDPWWAQFRREGSERERFLAIACAVLATGCIAAAYLDPGLLGPHVNLTRGLFFAYFTYSIVNLVTTRVHRGWQLGVAFVRACLGVVLASLVTIPTGGAHSPFLILYLLALLAAAERWGMKGTLVTAGACVVLLLVPSIAFTSWPDRVQRLNRGGGSVEGIVAVSVSLIIAGYLLGYLAEKDKRRHANALIISRLIGNSLPEVGLRATIKGLMHSVRDYFDADQVGSCYGGWQERRPFFGKRNAREGVRKRRFSSRSSRTPSGEHTLPPYRKQFGAPFNGVVLAPTIALGWWPRRSGTAGRKVSRLQRLGGLVP